MPKLSKVSFFLFVSVYNYLWLRIILFNNFYNKYGSMGFWYSLGIMGLVILLFMIIPKKFYNFDYFKGFKKSYIKSFYSIILILEIILGLCFCAYLLSQILITEANPLIILIILVLVITFISKLLPFQVMELSTLFNILGYVILAVSMMFFPDIDMTILLPIEGYNFYVVILYSFMVLADNLSLLIHKENVNFSKFTYLFGVIFALLMFSMEYMLVICSVGEEYLKDLNWVGFVCLSIKPVHKYIGNFDFAYIYYIMVCCIFKYSYNLSLIRSSYKINQKTIGVILSIVLICTGLIVYLLIPMNDKYLMYGTILLLLSFLIFLWMLKECYFVRKNKE